MKRSSWIGLGVGAAVALTLGGLWWALKGGPPALLATSSAAAPAPGPAASSGAPVDGDSSRGASQSPPDAGSKASDFFSQGLTLLDGALNFGRS